MQNLFIPLQFCGVTIDVVIYSAEIMWRDDRRIMCPSSANEQHLIFMMAAPSDRALRHVKIVWWS